MTQKISQPIIVSGKTPGTIKNRLVALKKKAIRVVDEYPEQLRELFAVRNPALRRDPEALARGAKEFIASRSPLANDGAWIYLPWNRNLVHVLGKDEFYELRTARNRNLITPAEQAMIRKAHIGVAGMSVGSSVASALVLEGVERLRIADADTLSLSNLNRIRAGVHHLGLNKVEIAAQIFYELHPYMQLETFPAGLTAASLKQFIAGAPKLTILVDEMDDLLMKIQLRQVARKLKIPVVSAADNGDGAIVDIERFDTEPHRPLFHGNVPELTEKDIQKLSFPERIDLINRMVGFEIVAERMKASVMEVGKSLYSWPQLGGAAMASGAAVAFVVTRLLRGENLKSGKYAVKFEDDFLKPALGN